MDFWYTVKRVMIAHIVLIVSLMLFPHVRGCFSETPEQILPIEFVVEATAMSAPPAPASADPIEEPAEEAPVAPPEPEQVEPPPQDPPPRPHHRVERSRTRVTRPADTPKPTQRKLTPEQVRQRLGPVPDTPRPPTGSAQQDASHIARIQQTMYQAWLQPVSPELNGKRAEITITLNADGSVASFRLRRSSGYPGLDESALAAVGSVKRIPGLPTDFIQRRKTMTIVFEVR